MINRNKIGHWDICTERGILICSVISTIKASTNMDTSFPAWTTVYKLIDPKGNILIENIFGNVLLGNGLKSVVENLDKLIQEYGFERTIKLLTINDL